MSVAMADPELERGFRLQQGMWGEPLLPARFVAELRSSYRKNCWQFLEQILCSVANLE
jgi:hypothetical protein